MHFSSLISKRKNVRVVILATTILFLTFMPWVPMAPIAAHAVPGSSVTDPGNVWTTNGPSVANLQFKFYSDPTAELNDFLTGHLDLNDWPTSTSDYASFDQSPDVTQSPT